MREPDETRKYTVEAVYMVTGTLTRGIGQNFFYYFPFRSVSLGR